MHQPVLETGIDAATGAVLVRIDPRYFRPTEFDLLQGDPSKARSKLGWQHKVSFQQLVAEMVAADLEELTVESRVSSPPPTRSLPWGRSEPAAR